MSEVQVSLGLGLRVTVDFSKPSKCKDCGQDIYWCVTQTGQRMPVIVHSNFVDCPKADEFRKKKEEAGKEVEPAGKDSE
jgi:hypothetical protein